MAVSLEGELLFTFNWRLENVSMWTYEIGHPIKSPTFLVHELETTGWCIMIDAVGSEFRCHLCRQKVREGEVGTVHTSFSLAVLATDLNDIQGSKLNVPFKVNESEQLCFPNPNCHPVEDASYKKIYMANDTLRIKCCFRRPEFSETKHKDDTSVLKTGHIKKAVSQFIRKTWSSTKALHSEKSDAAAKYESGSTKYPNELTVSSRIEVEHRSTLWSFNGFSKMKTGQTDSIVVPSTAADLPSLILVALFNNFDELVFQVQPIDKPKQICVLCSVDIVNDHDDSLKALEEQHVFPELTAFDEKQYWQLSSFISRYIVLKENSRYLKNDVLQLRIKLAISYEGRVSHTIGDTRFSESSIDSCRTENAAKAVQLPHLYEDKKFCDVRLNVSGVAIPVHKAVICSASSVFDAMFSSDMQESNTGEVNIPDFDHDTIDKLLIYIYSGAFHLEKMEIKDVVTLYSAADKYQILGLQDKCSDFLKSVIAEDNVCHILNGAELIGDVKLKKETIKFISVHALRKFTLEKWQLLLEKNPSIATDVMY